MDGFCYIPISQGGQELAMVQHTLDLGAPPHPLRQPLPGGLVPSGPCPAPADAQALRPQAPGKMEEEQSRQDGTLPPALLVLELSVSSPGPNGPDKARAFFLLFRWWFCLQFYGGKVHNVISLSPCRGIPVSASLPMLMFLYLFAGLDPGCPAGTCASSFFDCCSICVYLIPQPPGCSSILFGTALGEGINDTF